MVNRWNPQRCTQLIGNASYGSSSRWVLQCTINRMSWFTPHSKSRVLTVAIAYIYHQWVLCCHQIQGHMQDCNSAPSLNTSSLNQPCIFHSHFFLWEKGDEKTLQIAWIHLHSPSELGGTQNIGIKHGCIRSVLKRGRRRKKKNNFRNKF